MKKVLSVFFMMALLFTLASLQAFSVGDVKEWDGNFEAPTKLITNDGVYYYEISTAEELAYIAKTGGDWLGYNYILANDITLNSVELTYDANGNLTVNASTLNQWVPINCFTGIFDGAGHSISGVYVNTTSSAGFFTNNQGIVKNLTIKNSYIKGSDSVGGICGSFTKTGAEFSNCEFYGAVVGNYNVGGLIGTNDCSNIENCINYGNVFGESNVGGIVGKFEAYGIDNSKNYGKITATGNSVGGIAGNAYYPISGCVNYGDVSGNDYVGGIFGNIFWGSDVTNCGNVGKIAGNNYVGGLIGDNTGLWNDTTISNSYNTGHVIGNSKVGGLAGNISYGGVYNSYNVGNVSGTELVGAVVGYSDTIWGKGTASNCVYMKTETINATLKGFGNADDVDGVVNAHDASFFCINTDKTLNKNGHAYSSTVPCDATCDNCGYERTVTHSYDNVKYDSDKHWYECDCGEKKTNSESNHTYNSATCTTPKTCKVCGNTTGSKLSHKSDGGTVTKKATCTATGTKTYKCTLCKATIKTETIAKSTTHTYSNNCDKSCNVCGKTRTVGAHKGGTATCTKKAKCSVCGAYYGSLKAHSYRDVIKKASLSKNGKVENKCSVCGKVSKTTTIYYPKTITLSTTAYTYNGKVKTPTVTVKDSKGNTLKKDTDYTVKYESGRKVPGKYTVTITFKGKYTGTKTLYFTIAPKATSKITATQTTTTITLKWNKVTGADGYRVYKYNSKTKKYEKLKDVTGTSLKISKLKTGTAYKYKVRAYTKDDGTIWGAYSGAFETATKCKTPSITKLTTTKGKASYTWSNVEGESGYQVYYSTKKDSGYKKVASYKTNIVKGSKSKLTSGKTYYFKVRAYKKTASGTVYSAWSPIKSLKVK